jgi:hypothetical protein
MTQEELESLAESSLEKIRVEIEQLGVTPILILADIPNNCVSLATGMINCVHLYELLDSSAHAVAKKLDKEFGEIAERN